jgi:uncharacterized protein
MPTLEQARHWYPAEDPVHGFDHVLRVYHMAERLALAEGADLEIVRAAALLHDVMSLQPAANSQQLARWVNGLTANSPQKSENSELGQKPGNRLAHHQEAADFAAGVLRLEGWSEGRIAAVQHCIRSHRFRDPAGGPQTLEAKVLFDADKLDAIGATGIGRAIAFALGDGMPVYSPPSGRFLESGELEPGERHSAYHEYLFKLVRLKERLYTPSARLIAEERHRLMAEFFEALAAEMRGER